MRFGWYGAKPGTGPLSTFFLGAEERFGAALRFVERVCAGRFVDFFVPLLARAGFRLVLPAADFLLVTLLDASFRLAFDLPALAAFFPVVFFFPVFFFVTFFLPVFFVVTFFAVVFFDVVRFAVFFAAFFLTAFFLLLFFLPTFFDAFLLAAFRDADRFFAALGAALRVERFDDFFRAVLLADFFETFVRLEAAFFAGMPNSPDGLNAAGDYT